MLYASLSRVADQLERAAFLCAWLVFLGLCGMFLFSIPPVLSIGIVLFLLYRWRRRQPASGAHGTARWAGFSDLLKAGCLWRQSGFLLGRAAPVQRPSAWTTIVALLGTSLSRSADAVAVADARRGKRQPLIAVPDPGPPHVAVVGPSGSGKTTGFAVTNLLSDPANAVALDSKGDLYKLTSATRAQRFGHQIVVIDPFRIAAPFGEAAQFNPLNLFSADERMLVDDARRLAAALVVRQKDEKEPFWNSAAQVAIQAMIAFLNSSARPEEANLNRVRDLLTNPQVLREALDHMEKSEACAGMLRRLAGSVRWYQGQTEASIYSVANTHLEFLDSVPMAETLARTSFDPRQLTRGRMTIYLCLPVDRIQELRGLQRVLLTTLINLLFAAGESRTRRVRFYLDEAVSLGQIDALYNALVYGRSYGIRLCFFFQGTAQVEQCFPDSKAADFQSTVANIFCGVNDFRTAQDVSQWIGQTTVLSRSWQNSTNWGGSQSTGVHDISRGLNWGGGSSSTEAETARALILPDEVLQLPHNAAIALLPGVRPIVFEKQPYYAAQPRQRGPLWRCLAASAQIAGVLFYGLGVAPMLQALAAWDSRVMDVQYTRLAQSIRWFVQLFASG